MAGNSASSAYQVTVVGVLQQIVSLEATVSALPSPQGNGQTKNLRNNLLSDLTDAASRLQKSRPDVSGACHDLADFVHIATDPKNVQPKGPLPLADSVFLAGEATRIAHIVGC